MIRTVSTHTTGIEAHIFRCRLAHEGIPAFVAFEHHIWAMWSYSILLGGVRVQVPEVHLDAAKSIVRKIHAGEYEAELNTDELTPALATCPNCSSEKVQAINWPWKLSLVVLFLFVIPLPFTKHMSKCKSCSHKWIAHEQRGCPLSAFFFTMLAIAIALMLVYEVWGYWCKLHCKYPYLY